MNQVDEVLLHKNIPWTHYMTNMRKWTPLLGQIKNTSFPETLPTFFFLGPTLNFFLTSEKFSISRVFWMIFMLFLYKKFFLSQKHLCAKVITSLHLKYSEKGGNGKHNISFFLNISIISWKVCYFYAYLTFFNTKKKINNNLYMKFMNKINRIEEAIAIRHSF